MSTAPPPPRGPFRLSIAAYLGLGLGTLTFVAIAAVLALTLSATYLNTRELLADKSRLVIDGLVDAMRRHLDAIEAPTEALAAMIETGQLDPADHDRLRLVSRTLLAAAPQVHALIYVAADGWYVATFREGDGIGHEVGDRRDQAGVEAGLAEARARGAGTAYWAAPIYIEGAGTNLNLRRPIYRDDQLQGMVVAAITIADLSRFLSELETEAGQVPFILYNRDKVLAHWQLADGSAELGLGPERPIPELRDIGDPVLARIWREGWQERRFDDQTPGHEDATLGGVYVYLYQELDHYADRPWQVGSYFAVHEIHDQVVRMKTAAWLGLLVLAVAVAAAILFGRALRAPIERLAAAATALRDLDLERVPKLPASRFQELHDASQAFNAMVGGLRAFALYVPRSLVVTLIRRGDVTTLPSEARDVTVLFTDIAGFTARTQKMGAPATATFLNDHFRLLTKCIEDQGGMVDKYIGDAVMALWNTTEDQADQAARAVAAARAIAAALRADNGGRDQPVRLRIGIHTGPVVVGNIGTATRMNYTVIGDAVNAAQRLEVLAKDLLPAADVAVLVSAVTAGALPPEVGLTSLGHHRLRGLEAPIEVFAVTV